jgi:peptidoglycan hydrolase CwlO-like protein
MTEKEHLECEIKDLELEIEELQKYLDDNNITFEEYMRSNMITDEDRKYFDKVWMDAIYKNFGEDT